MILLPDVRQSEQWDCGRAEYNRVLTHHGHAVEANQWCGTPQTGTDPLHLEIAFRIARCPILAGHFTLESLAYMTDRESVPVVCLIQYAGDGHYVTVRGVKDGRVHFSCPSRGPRQSVTEKFWMRNWHDVGRNGARYRCWGVAVWPPEG